MTKFNKDLIEVIIIGLIVGTIGFLGITQYQQTKAIDNTVIGVLTFLRKDINDLRTEVTHSEDYNQFMFQLMNVTDNIIIATEQSIIKNIKELPNKIKYDKFMLEKKLQFVNVMIHNETLGALGSGVTLKYKGKFYILTAGHLLNKKDDKITFSQNDENFGELEVIKWNFDPTDITMNGIDLLLLQPKNKALLPKKYVELADYEPLAATEVYIVGNPMGIESVLSDGRVIIYEENYMCFIDHSYFGNSGGGIYTKDGKLIGINSIIINFDKITHEGIPYIIGGTMRLSVIKSFLKDVE